MCYLFERQRFCDVLSSLRELSGFVSKTECLKRSASGLNLLFGNSDRFCAVEDRGQHSFIIIIQPHGLPRLR
jgi:hypothetical protein